MLGFLAAISAEFASHKGLLQQYRMAPWPIAAVFLLFTVASLIPISKVCRALRDCASEATQAIGIDVNYVLHLLVPCYLCRCVFRIRYNQLGVESTAIETWSIGWSHGASCRL